MNRYKLTKAGIDVNQGINRFGGNKEVYESFLLKFPSETCYTEMCEAIASKDVKAAFAGAHSLKGLSGNLSMNKLYKSVYPLVEELRAGSLEQADKLLEPVKEDYQTIVNVIKEMADKQ